MAQNMENIDFGIYFYVTSQQWSLLKENCVIFEFLWTFLTKSIGYFVQSYFICQENAQSLQK